jgi:hypothetical protein
MNRTLIAVSVLLLAGTAGAASPSQAPTPSNDALEERIVKAEADARQREFEIRLDVLEHESQKVQAEFAVMMEELDQGKPGTQPAAPPATPKPAP